MLKKVSIALCVGIVAGNAIDISGYDDSPGWRRGWDHKDGIVPKAYYIPREGEQCPVFHHGLFGKFKTQTEKCGKKCCNAARDFLCKSVTYGTINHQPIYQLNCVHKKDHSND